MSKSFLLEIFDRDGCAFFIRRVDYCFNLARDGLIECFEMTVRMKFVKAFETFIGVISDEIIFFIRLGSLFGSGGFDGGFKAV